MSDDEREKYPSELAERFQVRLPAGLRDRIKADAEKHSRSMNAEIVARLEDFPKLRQRLLETIGENSKLVDDKERLEWELDQLENVRDRFFEKDGTPKPVLTVPGFLLERIVRAAEKNHRTIDAEAQSALEEAFPPNVIDAGVLVEFLEMLNGSNIEGQKDVLLKGINAMLSQTRYPYTVKAVGDGVITFYPYASPLGGDEDDK